MTSLKMKKINKVNNKLMLFLIVGVLTAVACFGLTVQGVSPAVADEQPKGEIETSLNFSPSGEEGTLVPFTFWQKVDSVTGVEMEQTYNYIFYPIDENGNRLDQIQPFPGEDPENPEGEPANVKEFAFSMTGNETKTFYIDFTKIPLIDKDVYLKSPYYTPNKGWYFNYRSELVKPEPPAEHYDYDNTYFDVKIWIPDSAITKGKLHVFCYNPIGQKVYDPGWTVTANIPLPPDEPSNPPQTVDPNWIIAIAAVIIFGVCVALAIADKKKKKQAYEQALANAGIDKE